MKKAANHCDMRLGIVGNFVIRQLTGNQLPGKMGMTTRHALFVPILGYVLGSNFSV